MLFAGLLALALTLSFVRLWLLPEIDRFRHELEGLISERLRQPVRIGKLRASLYQFKPQLRLLDVAIGDPTHPLRLREIQVVVNTLASIRGHDLAIDAIRLLGATLEIVRTPDGGIGIHGLGDERRGFPVWLSQDGKFELLQSTVGWRLEGRPETPTLPPWKNVSIRLHNRGPEHHLAVVFPAPTHWSRQASLHIRFTGDLRHPEKGRGNFLLGLRELRLPALQEMLSPLLPGASWLATGGSGDLRLRGNWRPRGIRAEMELALDHIRLRRAGTDFPLSLARLEASARGRWTPSGWRIDSPFLSLRGKGLEVNGRLSVNQAAGQSPDLDCFALITRLDLAPLLSQFPTPENPRLARWIAMQPFEGTLTGSLLWRGKPADYPFDGHEGVAEARLGGRDLTLRFLPHWPALEQADLQLTVLNDQVRLDLRQTRFAGNKVGPATGTLSLTAEDPILTIETASRVKLPRVLAALRQTPLKPAIDTLDRHAGIEGSGRLTLRVDIPLRHARHTSVRGNADLFSTRIALRNTPYFVTGARGRLHFDQNRLTTRLQGQFRQRPAEITASADKRHFDIQLLTRITPGDLPQALGARKYLQGETGIALHLVKQKGRPAGLSVRSDLQGMAVALPQPLGKPPDATRPLSLSTWLTETDALPFNLDYGPLHAFLHLDKKRRTLSGRIGINQPPPPPTAPAGEGLIVKGRLDRLDPLPWLKILRQGGPEGPDNQTVPGIRDLDIGIGHLTPGGGDLGAFRLTAAKRSGAWRGSLATPFGLGKWNHDPGRKQLTITFGRLGFQPLAEPGKSPVTDREGVSFAGWPVIRLNADHLDFHGQDLGRLEVEARPRTPKKLEFGLNLAAPTHRLDASGSWMTHPTATTHAKGRLTTPSLGDFLKRIDHPTALAGSPSKIDFDLDWNAPPYRFSLARLNGSLRLDLGPGRWLDVEPGAGRLFGLLYLGTLGRRLRLDFSDLFASGLSYDRIGGHIRLKNGLALTDDLMIEAVSARIYINGSVDLAIRRTDELITVIPNTPLTLGLLAERQHSPLGKAASRLQGMINTPLDSITQSQYAISGTWDDPVIVRLRRSVPGSIMHGIWSSFQQITGNHKSE